MYKKLLFLLFMSSLHFCNLAVYEDSDKKKEILTSTAEKLLILFKEGRRGNVKSKIAYQEFFNVCMNVSEDYLISKKSLEKLIILGLCVDTNPILFGIPRFTIKNRYMLSKNIEELHDLISSMPESGSSGMLSKIVCK
jgi:hypothetical protein